MIEPQPDTVERMQPLPLRRFAHSAMGCTFEVWLAEQDASYAGQAARAAFALLDGLERELSRYIPTSDVARINALRPGERIRVAIEVIECLQLATRVCDETGGAFDVAFRSRRDPASPPQPALELDAHTHSVGVRHEGVQIDLGGIGKGYAIDRMVETLRDWSIAAGLIHCGQSTVFALGRPADDQDWSVALRDPLRQERSLGVVRVRDAALSGSGRRLHGDHIVDPRTGQPVTDRLAAWALAPSAALADALSTAFMVMSTAELERYVSEHPEVSALIVRGDSGREDRTHFGPGLVI